MSKIQNVAAIDIGTSKIVAIVGNKDEFGKIKILGYGESLSKGVSHGTVTDVCDVSAAIREAVRQCSAMAGVPVRQVFVGMSGQNIRTNVASYSKFIANSVITQDDVEQLTKEVYNLNNVKYGEEIIHVIPQSYSVDDGVVGLSPVGFPGKKLDGSFYVVYGNATSTMMIKQAVSNAGLSVAKLIYQPIASAEALLSSDDKSSGVLLMDIGAGTTDVAIYSGKAIRTCVSIPFGGNSITSDIKSACQSLVFRQAEAIKKGYASALSQAGDSKKVLSIKGLGGRSSSEISVSDLSYIANARMDEILSGVAFIMQQSGYAQDIEEIVLTGGGSKLSNINQLVQYRLGRPVRITKPRDFVSNGNILDGEEYSAVIGLLSKGMAHMEEFYQKQKQQKNNPADTKQESSKDAADDTKKSSTEEKKKKGSLFSNLKVWAGKFFEDPEDSHL